MAGMLLAAIVFAWAHAAAANPYLTQQTAQDFRACGEEPSCLRVQYQQPYGPPPYQPYGQQPYQPYPPQPPYQSQGGSRRFDYPRQNGAIVDACVAWAYDCGRGGATQFCQQQGFRTAFGWDTFHPGQTYVIGSGKPCNGPGCTGFSYVVCGN